jgi:hypothetical protein
MYDAAVITLWEIKMIIVFTCKIVCQKSFSPLIGYASHSSDIPNENLKCLNLWSGLLMYDAAVIIYKRTAFTWRC